MDEVKNPNGRVAVITGGGYGIGRASGMLLARDGWSVICVDRDEARNQDTVNAIRSAGGRAEAVSGDVADPNTADQACEGAERFGNLRALVNAAAMRHAGSIVDISVAQWNETLSACLQGPFVFCKTAIPRMAASGGGAIVNFSSPDAQGRRGMIAYASAKAAIETFTRCLAVDHVSDHIRVNAIIPPFTVTGMTEHYPAERLAEMDKMSPSGRASRPEDIAELVRFLVSEESATLTGGLHGGTLPTR
jgi:NAD(P)-dependent dehydrogenase (short-subunit alcohol dehydrogenase family)